MNQIDTSKPYVWSWRLAPISLTAAINKTIVKVPEKWCLHLDRLIVYNGGANLSTHQLRIKTQSFPATQFYSDTTASAGTESAIVDMWFEEFEELSINFFAAAYPQLNSYLMTGMMYKYL